MIKDTCLGRSGAAGPPLRESNLGTSRKTRSPRSLHAQRSYIQQKYNEINNVCNTKNIQYNMHECAENFMTITMVQKSTKTELWFTNYG
jgi:cytidine deaminase